MAVTGKDSLFEASAGVALTAHTPSGSGATGGTWTVWNGTITAPVSLAGGGFVVSSGAIPNCYLSGSSSSAPDYVQCVASFSTDGFGGPALFSAGPGLSYAFYRFSGSWALYKDAGATQLATSSAAFATSTNYLMKLTRTVSGGTATLTCYLNGTQIMQATDTAYTGALYGAIAGDLPAPTFTNFECGTFIPAPDFTANDSAIQYYGRWALESSTQMWTINSGSAVEFVVAGTSTISLSFDTSNCANYPTIAYNVDGTGWQRATLDSSGALALTMPGSPYDAVSYTTHRVRFVALVSGGSTDWSSQPNAVRFLGISAAGGSLLSLPTATNQIEFLGDSIAAGERMLYTSVDDSAHYATEVGWCHFAADELGLEPIVNGHGGQGIVTVGGDGAPIANTAFPSVFSGAGWDPAIKPAIVVVAQGTNDSSFTQGQFQTFLTTIRAAYPSAYVFAITTPTNPNGSTISAAVTAQADARMFYLNYTGLTIATSDGTHPTIGGANVLGAQLATDIQTQLNSLGVKLQPAGGGGFAPVGSGFIRGL